MARVRIGHTHLTHCFLWKGEDPPKCTACDCQLTVKHILFECVDFIESRHFSVKPGSQCQEPVLRLGQEHQEHQENRVITNSQDKSWGILILETLSGISHRSIPDLSPNVVDNSQISLC